MNNKVKQIIKGLYKRNNFNYNESKDIYANYASMYSTKLELDEKESLIKFLCTKGQIVIKDGRKVFEFFGDIDLEDKWSAAGLLEKAVNNISKQVLGIVEKTDLIRNKEDFIFDEDEFELFSKYKGYDILQASLNPHNSEYAIQQLGLSVRFSSLNNCKKYITLFLNRD